MKHQGSIPSKERNKAIRSILLVLIAYAPCWALTFILGPFVVLTAKRTTNVFGETSQKHDDDYIAEGSSGMWYYVATAVKWLAPWNNLEDGLNGEPSGKHSSRVNGKEESFWARYQWLIRNPFNQGKRLSRFFACYVEDCDIEYWGSEFVTDKAPITEGTYWIKATDRTTGRVYYGYRCVLSNADPDKRHPMAKFAIKLAVLFGKKEESFKDTVFNSVFGFKIRPTHAGEPQGADDKDKSFTARVQFASKPD